MWLGDEIGARRWEGVEGRMEGAQLAGSGGSKAAGISRLGLGWGGEKEIWETLDKNMEVLEGREAVLGGRKVANN